MLKRELEQEFVEVRLRIPRAIYKFLLSYLGFTKSEKSVEEICGETIITMVEGLIKFYKIFDTPYNEKRRIIERYGLQYWIKDDV